MRNTWNGQLEVAVTPFTTEQRRRLEALTAARLLAPNETISGWMRLARFIISGAGP